MLQLAAWNLQVPAAIQIRYLLAWCRVGGRDRSQLTRLHAGAVNTLASNCCRPTQYGQRMSREHKCLAARATGTARDQSAQLDMHMLAGGDAPAMLASSMQYVGRLHQSTTHQLADAPAWAERHDTCARAI